MNNKFIIGVVLMLTLAGFALAENSTNTTNYTNATNVTVNTSANNSNTADNESEIQGKALEVRYEHLACKVEFTTKQIDLFDKYLDSNLSALKGSKETLNDQMDVLESYVEDKNKTAFDAYVDGTFRTEFNNVTKELNRLKSNFKQYNLSNETSSDIKKDLKDLKKEYSSCVSDKEEKMAKVMYKHVENWQRQYQKSIDKMKRNGLNTTEMEQIMANMTAKNQELNRLIASGNVTKMKEFMEQFRHESKKYATEMEIEKIRSYKDRLDNETKKYNKTDKMNKIEKHLEDASKYAKEDSTTEDEDFENAWENIHEANKDMKNLSKDILKERAREHSQNRSERNEGKGRGKE